MAQSAACAAVGRNPAARASEKLGAAIFAFVVASVALGRRDFFDVLGYVFCQPHRFDPLPDTALDEAIAHVSAIRRDPLFHSQVGALYGVFCFLLVAVSGSSRRAFWLAMDLGAGSAVDCGRLFDAR